jgi:hypothetical protein
MERLKRLRQQLTTATTTTTASTRRVSDGSETSEIITLLQPSSSDAHVAAEPHGATTTTPVMSADHVVLVPSSAASSRSATEVPHNMHAQSNDLSKFRPPLLALEASQASGTSDLHFLSAGTWQGGVTARTTSPQGAAQARQPQQLAQALTMAAGVPGIRRTSTEGGWRRSSATSASESGARSGYSATTTVTTTSGPPLLAGGLLSEEASGVTTTSDHVLQSGAGAACGGEDSVWSRPGPTTSIYSYSQLSGSHRRTTADTMDVDEDSLTAAVLREFNGGRGGELRAEVSAASSSQATSSTQVVEQELARIQNRHEPGFGAAQGSGAAVRGFEATLQAWSDSGGGAGDDAKQEAQRLLVSHQHRTAGSSSKPGRDGSTCRAHDACTQTGDVSGVSAEAKQTHPPSRRNAVSLAGVVAATAAAGADVHAAAAALGMAALSLLRSEPLPQLRSHPQKQQQQQQQQQEQQFVSQELPNSSQPVADASSGLQPAALPGNKATPPITTAASAATTFAEQGFNTGLGATAAPQSKRLSLAERIRWVAGRWGWALVD